MFSCTKRITTEEEKEREKIVKNHIRKVTEYVTVYHLGIPEDERVNYVNQFDEKGCRIKSIAYGEHGEPERIMECQYDPGGRVISILGLNPDRKPLYKETRAYDKGKRELYFYLPDGTYKYRNTAIYDNEGKMTELRWYWPDGLKAINRYVYNNTNMVENCVYGPDETLRYRWKYKYDTENNLIEVTQYSSDNAESHKISYNYNPAGLLARQVNIYSESILPAQKITIYEYDRKNLLSLKKELTSGEKISAIYRYSYEFH